MVSMTSLSGAPAQGRRLQVFLWGFLVLLVLVLGWSTVYRVAWDDVTHTDYTVYRAAGQAVLDGGNIYTVQNEHGWNYVYPPPFALLLVPLARLSLAVGSGLWYVLEIVAIGLSSLMSVSLLGKAVREVHKPALYALPLLYLSTLLVSGIQRCQASEFIVFLVVACAFFHVRGRPLLAGMSLAAAAVIKVFPLALLAYFVIRRQWRVVFASVAGLLLMLFVLPSLFWGWHQNTLYLNDWLDTVARPALMSNAERASATPLYAQLMNTYKSRNQSLEALFLSVHVAPALIKYGVAAVGLVMLGVMVAAARRVRSRYDELALLSAFVIWQLLIPPISETHYFGMLILPLTVIMGRLFYGEPDARRRRRGLYALGGMMLVAMVMIGWTATELVRPLCLVCLLMWVWLLRGFWQPPALRPATPG